MDEVGVLESRSSHERPQRHVLDESSETANVELGGENGGGGGRKVEHGNQQVAAVPVPPKRTSENTLVGRAERLPGTSVLHEFQWERVSDQKAKNTKEWKELGSRFVEEPSLKKLAPVLFQQSSE